MGGKDKKDAKKKTPEKKPEKKSPEKKTPAKKGKKGKKKGKKGKEEEEEVEAPPIPSGNVDAQLIVSLNGEEFSRPHPFKFFSGAIGAMLTGPGLSIYGPVAGGTSVSIPCDPDQYEWLFDTPSIKVFFSATKKPVEGKFVAEPVPCITCKTPSVSNLNAGEASVKVSLTGNDGDAVPAAHLPCEFTYYKNPKVTHVTLEGESGGDAAAAGDGSPPPQQMVVVKGKDFPDTGFAQMSLSRSGATVVVDATYILDKKTPKVWCFLPEKADLPGAPKPPEEAAEESTAEGDAAAAPVTSPVPEEPPLPLVVEVSFNGQQFTENKVQVALA